MKPPPQLAFLGYRVLARVAEVLPASTIEPISTTLGRLAPKVLPAKRQVLQDNLAPVIGRQPSGKLIEKAFASYIRFWLDSLRLPAVPHSWLESHLQTEGLEFLEQAIAEDRPIVVALAHLGNWDVAGAYICSRGTDLTVVVEKLNPPRLFEWFKGFRESLGMEVLTDSPQLSARLIERLKDGGAVALLCDRDVHRSGKPAKFFGRTVSMVRGPAVLALRTNAVLLPMAIYQADKANHHALVCPPIDVTRSGNLREDTERVTTDLLAVLEDLIRRAPEQWHVFTPFWNKQSGNSQDA